MTRPGSVEYLRRIVRERIESEGLRPLSLRTGVPLGQLRSLVQGRAARSTTLELIASVLGLEFYIGPARPGASTSPELPPEITRALDLPRDASVADVVGAIDKDAMASRLREGIGHVQELMARAAAAAVLIGGPVSDRDSPARDRLGGDPASDRDSPARDRLDGDPASDRDSPARDRLDGDVAMIPFAPDVRLAAGTGEVVFEESWEVSIAVAADALASWAGPERLTCVRAAGDSMEPTIRDGDLVAVDSGRTDPLDGHLFAVRTDAGLVVKRLRQTGGRWLLISDNPAHAPRPVGKDDRILGQIAWCGPQGRRAG